MTIKKRNTAPAPSAPAAPGGAAIADRFKLDVSDGDKADKRAVVGRTSALMALIAGLLALGTVGLLTYFLWKHWEFLMPL